jgi:molecular chaperone IbpA
VAAGLVSFGSIQFFQHLLKSKNRKTKLFGVGRSSEDRKPAGGVSFGVSASCCFKEDMTMTANSNFAPLFRSSVGFDRVFNLLENAQRTRSISDWPPYDIVKTGEDTYKITVAVAGFRHEDLDLTYQSNLLTIVGKKEEAEPSEYLHRGIAGRPFEHRFELADHVRVSGAALKNGLLSIELVREIPEAMKPRKIAIGTDNAVAGSMMVSDVKDKKAA